jgi:hypothetical protein
MRRSTINEELDRRQNLNLRRRHAAVLNRKVSISNCQGKYISTEARFVRIFKRSRYFYLKIGT